MNKKIFLPIAILIVSSVWQPTHHHMMASGMAMTSEVHSLITMLPFLAILLLLVK
ncbi:MAG: hypothetical protein AAGE96_14090 [Cyanobacteria bacterium P01_G01_bin.19]